MSLPALANETELSADQRVAVSERGVRLHHSDAQVDLALRLLVLNGGRVEPTVKMLKEEGLSLTRATLQGWRTKQFPRRYWQIRQELGKDMSEEVAGRALERALQADEAAQAYVEKAVERLPEVPAEHLAKNALSLTQAMSVSVEKAQLLRERPTEIVETRSVSELFADLERLGVIKDNEAIDAEVVEEEDVE